MALSLHRAMLRYRGGILLHTASSGRIAGLDTLYLRHVDADGIDATGEVRINIAYLNGMEADAVVAEALDLLPRLDLRRDPEDLIADPPAAFVTASAPLRMLVDVMLHDRAAKRAGLPLCLYLTENAQALLIPLPGPSPRPSRADGESKERDLPADACRSRPITHPTNQTLFVSDDKTFLRQAKGYVERGFCDLKVRIGAGDFADDLRRIRLLRERVGDAVAIAADANAAWSLEDAPRRLDDLAALGLAYLEQPVPPMPFDDLAKLAETSPVPIMLDESVNGRQAIGDLAVGGHKLMAHLKLVKLGGIAPTLDAARTLCDAGVPLMIGQMNEGGLATAAALHVSATVRPRYAELYGADGLENDPADGLAYRTGCVAAPSNPGLGPTFAPDRTETLWRISI